MVKVQGIGGIFFRSENPSALAVWYQTHFGIDPAPTSTNMSPWSTEAGVTVFAPFDNETDYFPKDRAYMLNFRVDDLSAAVKELEDAGIEISDAMEMDGIGRFARVHDPEGNPIELWEPAKT